MNDYGCKGRIEEKDCNIRDQCRRFTELSTIGIYVVPEPVKTHEKQCKHFDGVFE